ncbi:hypothetical protein NITHO_1040022 [Nitrolancea hollandica Lb]|uniref:Uncharacterized protein n=1 Tax=Nitrolancea hollandica Lb TaxID=1129897 RepID=I4ECI7_9BACT|nr:hypothetical protein NITHO_1040022 [Nitrolancea hollandica Lb]
MAGSLLVSPPRPGKRVGAYDGPLTRAPFREQARILL